MKCLAAALLLASTAVCAQQACEVNGEPVDTSIGGSTRGKTGLMRCRDASGRLQREQELRNGAFVGVERFFHADGRLREEHARNERGNKHGPAREFAADGQLLREATYEDGRELGLVRSFHAGGAVRRVSFHGSAGREEAHAEFTPRGQLASLRCGARPVLAPAVDDARLCGFAGPADIELFDAGGRVRTRLRYVDGKPVRAENLNAGGIVASSEEIVGQQRIEKRFSPEGKLQREQVWAGGEVVAERSWYLNGQPRSSTEWQRGEGRVERLVRDFHDNGQLAAQGTFVAQGRGRSVAVGTHARFDESGRKVQETLHDAQGRVTRERLWDAQGTLVRDDEVFEDGSRRAFSR